ncbi:5-oxopent-3-ene-1,2,5-tricarboxylatedecarboxylase [Catenulispora acidiphila DSM 44928]|uniref:5-oxopent-3-ene-1,2, 5-tricarboxylatedecarboxylase n=1 Tax=Catenulispora acidiphila (strain DSM 44928 / JCM 14897 / NBRC 102108 / NRRL B-24433 / ID139908) TaxID=479433 RepID=C7Q8J7_CATAD|nr:fumarylacetoacetate hydrolase family protein [Catenulispora acidiphila]ACU70262.1 5-oxopent-3-ene-1,2,5-tricarboxylatedecarboxylase [Catenulispora acidiphila DSM 44928]
MRIARFSVDDEVKFGLVEGEGDQPESLEVAEIVGHPFGPVQVTQRRWPLSRVRLLAPVLPSKVIGIGRNYAEHAAELGNEAPGKTDPAVVFLKPSTSVIGPSDAIQYPLGVSFDVQHEAELAVVIGRMCRQVPVARVPDVVLGYTCGNDVTARDLQRAENQWGRAKGFDTFCPLGPWIETELDPGDLAITCTVDGELKQAGRTVQMTRPVADLVSYVSEAMTLLPGDVILTGTPAGVGPIVVGQQVSVGIEGIGNLTNRVVARD